MYGRMGSTTLLSVPGVRVIVAYLLSLLGIYPVVYHGITTGGSGSAAANTTALQALWSTACAAGGTIFWPKGTFPLNAIALDHNLGFNAPVNMIGSGGTTVIHLYGTTGPFLNFATNAASGLARCILRDLRIQHAEVPTAGATIQFGYVSQMLLQNVRIPNAGDGKGSIMSVRLTKTGLVTFRDCKFETRTDITQLSYDNLTPIGLEIATDIPVGGLFIDDTDFSGVIAGGASVSGGQVTSVTVSSVGSGYTSPPTVSFSGGGGTGATATAVLTGDKVTGVTITNGGTGYTSAPTVSFSGGGGTGAAAVQSTRGTGIRFLNTALIDTIWFGPGTLIKDWDGGIVYTLASGSVMNVMANGLVIDACTVVNLQIEPTAGSVGTWLFSNCWMASQGYNVVLAESGGTAQGFLFANCYFTDAKLASFAIASGVDNVMLIGNIIASTITDPGNWAIDVNGTNADILIAGNRITAPASAAGLIRIGASVTPVVVTGNIMRGGADADGISFGGATGAARVNASNAYLA